LKHDANHYAASEISGKNNVASFHCQFNISGVAQQLDPLIFGRLYLAISNSGEEFLEILLAPLLDRRRKGQRSSRGERQRSNEKEESAREQQKKEVTLGHKLEIARAWIQLRTVFLIPTGFFPQEQAAGIIRTLARSSMESERTAALQDAVAFSRTPFKPRGFGVRLSSAALR
jgi:hypothetical protein